MLVIGGGPGMPGAARLAGEAALRAGAGLVTVAVHPRQRGIVAARPELMSHGCALGPRLARSPRARHGGCGRARDSGRRLGAALFEAALARGLPLIVDADALNLLAERTAGARHWVLTPHPGEAARLLGSTSARSRPTVSRPRASCRRVTAASSC